MKTLTLKLKTSVDIRAVLGACWDRGLPPNADDTTIEEFARGVVVELCQDEIKRRRIPRESANTLES